MENNIKKYMKKRSVIFLDQLAYRFTENNVVGTGAQLTYFLILSLFPFLMVLLNIISYTPLGREDVILDLIQYMPTDIQEIIQTFHDDVVSASSQSFLSIAAIAGLWTASSGVKAVIRAINKAYDYSENRSFLKMKGLSLLFTVILILMILVVFISLVAGRQIGILVSNFLGIEDLFVTMWNYLRFIIPILFMILSFALLYKYSPNIKHRHSVPLRTTLPGAIFTTISWIVLSLLFSFYVSNFGNYALTYGSLGGVIVLLVWLFISSIVIVLGGEINATLELLRTNGYRALEGKSVLLGFLEKNKDNDTA
ncbi:YihY/virulence factor BrkB family protein [Gudongella sp. SC589]|jgi:membrane protein|uniref:YihY/virulence factor BrkB family protein n=1 Tax=Gudongella sp. SC589 TaxID=3385990 RepID=UPI003904D901